MNMIVNMFDGDKSVNDKSFQICRYTFLQVTKDERCSCTNKQKKDLKIPLVFCCHYE